MPSADYRRAVADRILPMRTRGDLHIVETAFAGDAAYMVKDPVTGEIFQLSSEEHALLTALRQPVSLRSLQRELETSFAPRRATIEQIQEFVNRVYEQGLLVGEIPGRGAELCERGRRHNRRERWSNLLQLLSIRVGGFDAGPLVDRLYRSIGWMFSRAGAVAVGLLLVAAIYVVVSHAGQIDAGLSGLQQLAQSRWLPIWFAAVALVKVAHEFGHALACRRFGARPREMGVLLLAGMPSLYCDVSDAWRLPSKWQRIAVSAGGMFVELIIASLAAIIWSISEPGIVQAVALSLLVVCSVGTLAINANPLLRYDGYYILSDWLETPNLAERARGLVSGAWRRWLLDEPDAVDPLLSPAKRKTLWLYAIGAKVYLALVMTGLFILMLKLARPYQLQNLVYSLAAVTLAGMLAHPIGAAVRLATNPLVRSRWRWDRAALSAAALLLGLTALYYLPMDRRVEAPLVIVPQQNHPLFAVAAGELRRALPAGAEVAAGDVVVELHNPELELARAEAAATVRERAVRVAQLRALQATSPAAGRQLPAARAELADAEAQLAEYEAMVASLTIHAPHAGRVVAAPDRPADRRRHDQLATWNGSPLDPHNLGAWIEPKTPLCVIAGSATVAAWAGVEQADVPVVSAGQTVRVLVDEQPFSAVTGRVTHVASRGHANHAADRESTSSSASPLGDVRYHDVKIELDDALPLLPGSRGVAKITIERSNLGTLVMNALGRTFHRVF